MVAAGEEAVFFEHLKPELCARHLGQFALILGRHLLGVYASLEDALAAAADRFDAGALPGGVSVFISEIAEEPRLRVVTEHRAG